MTIDIQPINVDNILSGTEESSIISDLSEYKNQIKRAILDVGFEKDLREFLHQVSRCNSVKPMEFCFCPKFRQVTEKENFSETLKECVTELLFSEQYVFNISIEAMQDGYNVKIGISPK